MKRFLRERPTRLKRCSHQTPHNLQQMAALYQCWTCEPQMIRDGASRPFWMHHLATTLWPVQPPEERPGLGRDEQSASTLSLVNGMPSSGDPCPGFIAELGRCWQMVYSRQLQATHCQEQPSWTGRWFSPRGDRWFRVWACPDHVDGLTGLRQFGGWALTRIGPAPDRMGRADSGRAAREACVAFIGIGSSSSEL